MKKEKRLRPEDFPNLKSGDVIRIVQHEEIYEVADIENRHGQPVIVLIPLEKSNQPNAPEIAISITKLVDLGVIQIL